MGFQNGAPSGIKKGAYSPDDAAQGTLSNARPRDQELSPLRFTDQRGLIQEGGKGGSQGASLVCKSGHANGRTAGQVLCEAKQRAGAAAGPEKKRVALCLDRDRQRGKGDMGAKQATRGDSRMRCGK